MISVTFAICFLVSIGLGDTPLLYYAARLSDPQDGDVIFFDLGAVETSTLEKLVADPPEAVDTRTALGGSLFAGLLPRGQSYSRLVEAMERVLVLGFSVDTAGAIVFLEGFSREAVKSERGNGAFEAWGRDAPGAKGTAPTSKIAFDQIKRLFIRLSIHALGFEQVLPLGGDERNR